MKKLSEDLKYPQVLKEKFLSKKMIINPYSTGPIYFPNVVGVKI